MKIYCYARTLFLCLTMLAASSLSLSQPDAVVPMEEAFWSVEGEVSFITHKGVAAIRLDTRSSRAELKAMDFANGTIEFDVKPVNGDFTGIDFRKSKQGDSETFYLRTFEPHDLKSPTAIQYAPVIKGVNLWNLYAEHQAPALIVGNTWNHVKLVVSGKRLLVFVNADEQPSLEVTHLEGESSSGTISFYGNAIFANLRVDRNAVAGLTANASDVNTRSDPRYLRAWKASSVSPLAEGIDLRPGDIPVATATWKALQAEQKGLVNLSRYYNLLDGRHVIWLKTTINSDYDQRKRVAIGFSDEVWVFANGKYAFVDKNLYGQPIMKKPEGRVSAENASFELPLVKGSNEIVIGVANNFFGWGLMFRLDNLVGVTF
ncbi:hypothetical protein [Teredinibacter haidensis]|uniref:hypothetical protein n=1 Tax=Teredinibacter haidensis TaxID=2731755 RepID=UPI000A5234FF|nr:hypothetical protein [Teredinibacter haidensis]